MKNVQVFFKLISLSWTVRESNVASCLTRMSFLRCATSASISIDGIGLEGDSGCAALIFSCSIHARSSAIVFYPAWACVDKCPVFSMTFLNGVLSPFFFAYTKFGILTVFLTPVYICVSCCLFLTFYIHSWSPCVSSMISLKNLFFRFSLYLYLAFLCWVELLIGMLNIQHCRLWESVAG